MGNPWCRVSLLLQNSINDTLIIFFSVTLSPVSVAALGLISDSRGLSLRFPRFIKVRADKTLEEASNPEFLAKIWQDQQGKAANSAGADDGDLVDVELVEEGDEDED